MRHLCGWWGVGVLVGGCVAKDGGDDTGTADTVTTRPGGDGVCSTWTGYVAGRTWRYAYDPAAATQGSWEDTLATIGADGAVTVHQELSQANAATTYVATTDTDYRCDDDGLWLLSTHSEWVSTFEGVESEGWLDATWDAAGPIQPRGLALGARWDWAYDYSYTASYGDGAQAGYVTYEVESVGAIEVPAGDYEAAQVFQTTDQGASLRTWVADDVGLVATEAAELVAVFE